jgi:hypothetical protein
LFAFSKTQEDCNCLHLVKLRFYNFTVMYTLTDNILKHFVNFNIEADIYIKHRRINKLVINCCYVSDWPSFVGFTLEHIKKTIMEFNRKSGIKLLCTDISGQTFVAIANKMFNVFFFTFFKNSNFVANLHSNLIFTIYIVIIAINNQKKLVGL